MASRVAFEVEPIVDALERDGYVVVEGVLDRDTVDRVKAELDRVLESTPKGRNDFEGFDTRRIYRLFAKTRAFDDFGDPSGACSACSTGCSATASSARRPASRSGRASRPRSCTGTTRSIPLPEPHGEVVLNTMWAFDDFTAENGATRFVPGSHRWEVGRRPTADDRLVLTEMPAGSVAFYTGSIWHGGGANRTETPRLGVILEYVAAWLRPQENHVIGVAPEVVATLPERLQELLGYNIYPAVHGLRGRPASASISPWARALDRRRFRHRPFARWARTVELSGPRNGASMDVLYTAIAHATGDGRNGHVQSEDGLIDTDVRIPKEMGGPEDVDRSSGSCSRRAIRRASIPPSR